MKVIGTNQKQYIWKLTQTETNENASQYHKIAKEILSNLFPLDTVFQECFLPGCKTKLYLDFYLPLRKLALEISGDQHYNFNSFFHGDILGFWRSNTRDNEKRRWCELNEIQLIELDYRETEKWTQQILSR